MKAITGITCPACKKENSVAHKLPGFLETVMTYYECRRCSSHMMLQLRPGRVGTTPKGHLLTRQVIKKLGRKAPGYKGLWKRIKDWVSGR